jgi:hypothetical protein
LILALVGTHVAADALQLSNASVTATQTFNGLQIFSEAGTTLLHKDVQDNNLYADALTGRLASISSSFFTSTLQQRQTDLSFKVKVTNDGTDAQQYALEFTVNAGHLIDAGTAGAASAELSAGVRLDGASVWNTAASCSGRTCSRTGVDIGYLEHLTSVGNGYTFERYGGQVSLGLLAPGQSVNVSYSLHTGASSLGTASGDAAIRPFAAFSSSDFSGLGGVAITAVPEPSAGALFVSGLCLLVALRRRSVVGIGGTARLRTDTRALQ